jgi:hypothetical protein
MRLLLVPFYLSNLAKEKEKENSEGDSHFNLDRCLDRVIFQDFFGIFLKDYFV